MADIIPRQASFSILIKRETWATIFTSTTARYLSSPAFNGLLILQKVLLTFIPKVQCDWSPLYTTHNPPDNSILQGVVWVDAQFSNMLLTDDLRIVLSDFGGSSWYPKYRSTIQPAMVWVTSRAWLGGTFIDDQDRYAFGIALFVLLTLRWPHTPSLQIDTDEEVDAIYERHEAGDFDTSVADKDFPILAKVIQKCWQLEYQSTDELLADVQLGRKACSKLCEKLYWPFRVADDHYLHS